MKGFIISLMGYVMIVLVYRKQLDVGKLRVLTRSCLLKITLYHKGKLWIYLVHHLTYLVAILNKLTFFNILPNLEVVVNYNLEILFQMSSRKSCKWKFFKLFRVVTNRKIDKVGKKNHNKHWTCTCLPMWYNHEFGAITFEYKTTLCKNCWQVFII